ncbi:hypothetical protein NLI92_005256 [Priestia megaterium]|uniref:hypothetical protein n=1 Tax=Priestia megaterium TaxID=1404 RepID=UPI0021ACE68B|nr:hypothetical protein [Priestia megaterium]MCR8929745.1 hypothetical protein [Priestia megaterium]
MPNKEYLYYFIKVGKLYYVNKSYENVKRKGIFSCEFTNDKLVAFLFHAKSITKQTSDECGGYIVVKKVLVQKSFDRDIEPTWSV